MVISAKELRENFWILDPEKYLKMKGYKYKKIGDMYCIWSKLKFRDRCYMEDLIRDYDIVDIDEAISIINDIYYSESDVLVSDRLKQKDIIEYMMLVEVLQIEPITYTLHVNNKFLMSALDI